MGLAIVYVSWLNVAQTLTNFVNLQKDSKIHCALVCLAIKEHKHLLKNYQALATKK